MKPFAFVLLLTCSSVRGQIPNPPPGPRDIKAQKLQFVPSWTFEDLGQMTVISASMSADGRWIAAGIEGNQIRVWQNGALLRTDASSEYRPLVRLSFDGRLLASAGGPENSKNSQFLVTVREMATGKMFGTIASNDRWKGVPSFTLSPVAPLLAMSHGASKKDSTTLPDQEVAGFDLSAPPFRQIGYLAGKRWGTTLQFTPDGRSLAICCETDRGVEKQEYDTGGNPYKEVTHYERYLHLWNLTTGQPGKTFAIPCSLHSLAFSRNGRWMAAGCSDDYVHHKPKRSPAVVVWDMQTGQQIGALRRHTTDVLSVAFSPDDRLLATASTEVRVWETAKWSLAWEGDPCRNWSSGLNWESNGRYLLVNCSRSIVLLRRDGEVVVPPGPPAELKPLPMPKPPEPVSQEKLLEDLKSALTLAGARHLNELKKNPADEVAESKMKLSGADFCAVVPYLPGRRIRALSLKCYFDTDRISVEQLFEVARRAAPQLNWTTKTFAWGLDASNEIIIRVGNKSDRIPLEIVESR